MATAPLLDLKHVLNQLLIRPQPTPTGAAGRPRKSGREQIQDNADDIIEKSTVLQNTPAEVLGLGPCIISTASVDGRGRPVRSMRVAVINGQAAIKREFRAYHVTWIAEFGIIPNTNLQYSHRCHQGQCVNPKHGTWEDDLENKSRNKCQEHSHLRLPNDAVVLLCQHPLPCLSPAPDMDSWQDARVLVPPTVAPALPPAAPPAPSSPPWPEWPSTIPDSEMSYLSSPPPSPTVGEIID